MASINNKFKDEIVKYYKLDRKIKGYIRKTYNGFFEFCTGKPSDISCLMWRYNNLKDAQKTGDEYFENYIKMMSSIK